MKYAIIDGHHKPIVFYTPSLLTVSAEVSFFWYNLTLDPNFSILIGMLATIEIKSTYWKIKK